MGKTCFETTTLNIIVKNIMIKVKSCTKFLGVADFAQPKRENNRPYTQLELLNRPFDLQNANFSINITNILLKNVFYLELKNAKVYNTGYSVFKFMSIIPGCCSSLAQPVLCCYNPATVR